MDPVCSCGHYVVSHDMYGCTRLGCDCQTIHNELIHQVKMHTGFTCSECKYSMKTECLFFSGVCTRCCRELTNAYHPIKGF